MPREFVPYATIDPSCIQFAIKTGSDNLSMVYGQNCLDMAFVTPACITNWPRVTGDGNFGTMWGPAEESKAKYTLDLTNVSRTGDTAATTDVWEHFTRFLDEIDNKLLDFVYQNQQRILNRKNLSRDEIKMLQIRSVRPKYDKTTGQLINYTFQMSTPKYCPDGMGGRYMRMPTVCDYTGRVLPNGTVAPGDAVSATCYAKQVYTGVGGDKFGIHWSFCDVAVVCQRAAVEHNRLHVSAFQNVAFDGASAYKDMECTSDCSNF